MKAGGLRRTIVVGGGLGGLTAALSLRQAGFETVVLERQERRGQIEAGAGLFIWHNAVRALQRVGVADAVLAVSSPPVERFEMRSWRGKPIMSFAAGDVSRKMGSATVGVTRPALHAALSAALEPGVLRLGQTCVGFEQDGNGVTVQLGNGGEERADLLVGADGTDSTVREQLFGPTRRRYAGYTSWRGSLDFDREVVPVGTFTKFWGRGARLLYYYIGGGRLYWLALPQAPEGGRDGQGKRRSNVLGHYRGWVDPVEAVLEATDESAIHREDIYDRDPLKQWGKGRVTLLGDAAHPMTPNLGQGACQAIEDAVVLGTRLGAEVDVPTALRAFEAQRRPRTTSFQRRSRLIGAAGLLRSRAACTTRDALLRLVFAERSPILRRDTRAELELEL